MWTPDVLYSQVLSTGLTEVATYLPCKVFKFEFMPKGSQFGRRFGLGVLVFGVEIVTYREATTNLA